MKAAMRVAAVAISAFLGLLFAVGSLLAAMLERDGFTSAASNGPRPGYLLLLAAGLIASIAVPTAIAVLAFPDSRRIAITAGVLAAVGGLGLFGLAAA